LQQQLNGSKVRIPAVGRINYNGNSGAATAISTTELAKAEGVTPVLCSISKLLRPLHLYLALTRCIVPIQ